ncbi:MAG: glycoside hydrolase, partial [Actinomycetota bacterium]|nr:glycoside hydrolase [Actinomycetota bacterium]
MAQLLGCARGTTMTSSRAAIAALLVVFAPSAAGASEHLVADPPVVVFSAGPGAMAEATITADPARPGHLAAAADPYLGPVRILVATSNDGGATWSEPVTILPDGFAKSYDPSLAFDASGDLLVVGGASGRGAAHCQVGSAIFLARVQARGTSYTLVRDGRADLAYVDRPAFAMANQRDGQAYVTWTESSGAGAECLGVPNRSTTMLARLSRGGSVADTRPIPSSGLAAPFGSAIAVSAGRVVNVAVIERDNEGGSRLVVVRSRDGGTTLENPVVVANGPDVDPSMSGLGG